MARCARDRVHVFDYKRDALPAVKIIGALSRQACLQFIVVWHCFHGKGFREGLVGVGVASSAASTLEIIGLERLLSSVARERVHVALAKRRAGALARY